MNSVSKSRTSTLAKISTHVLDTAHGHPAAGMAYRLEWLGTEGQDCELLRQGRTNADGRTDEPLVAGANLRVGVYALHFDVDAYFRHQNLALPQPPFLDRVTLRFGVADAAASYHIPLLVSPWSYSTYRGS